RLARVRRMANLFDSRFALPGTRIRFGLDSLIGLLPGVGDLAGAAAGLWLIAEAAKLKVPKSVLARMCVNLGIDVAGGTLPIAGDIFDLFWRSNDRNAKLLQKHIASRFPNEDLSAD
ncbi:MAG: DUF4112 domain-containing protein, partial [Planctomycetota bacterium]